LSKLPLTQIALILVCAGYFIASLGNTAFTVAIPALAAELNASATQISWLPTLYILSSVAFMLPFGKLADNIGRKRLFVAGLSLNIFAAGMCAISTHVDWMLFWRFIQGAAGAMIFGVGIAIITSVTPSHKRGAAFGIVATCVYVGLTMGPAVGGWLTEWLGWRAVFYFQIPFVIVLLIFIKLKLHGEWKNELPSRFDWLGSGVFMVFTFTLVYGLSKLPSIMGILLIAASFASLTIFIIHQRDHQHPLIRVQMFRESRVFSLSLSTSFLMYASNFGIVFLLSLYLQYIRGFSPSEAGQILLIQALFMAVVAPIAGKLADRFQARIIATLGCTIVLGGFIMLNQINFDTSAIYICVALAIFGIGFGLFSTPNNSAIMGAVGEHEVGVASSSMNLSRTIGNLVGMSLVNLMMHHYLGDANITPEQSPALLSTISLALLMSLSFVFVACIMSAMRGRQ
jgi:EmrB/QacA subfamily drug resistance transporter